MNWIYMALLSAAILGVVNILDSHLISKRMPTFRVFLLLVGGTIPIFGLVLFYIFPLPADTGLRILLVATASSLIRSTAVIIMLHALKEEEVSQVVPVVHTYPIFVAIMAVPLLGESLQYLEWLAIIIVVAGAAMISVRPDQSGSAIRLGKPFFALLFGSSLLFALADVTAKYVLEYISSGNLAWFNTFAMAAVFLLVSVRPQTFRQLNNLKRRSSALGLLALNETLAIAGTLLSLWAIKNGPVSLVSTIIGSRPIFVVIFALILSRVLPQFLDWHPGRGMLALRLVATALIVSGITIIHIS